MGTTRIKVIDLSGQEQQIKTSRKHAEKLSALAKIKEEKKAKGKEEPKIEKAITEGTEDKLQAQKEQTTETPSVSSEPSAPSVIKKPSVSAAARKHTHHRGKKYQKVASYIDRSKVYETSEALDLLAKSSPTKFDPTVEIHLNVTDKNLRGSVNFPHAVGAKRQKRYLVFGDQKPETRNQKQLIWGDEKTIADIETGKLKPNRDFDALITSPKYMPSLAKIAKILGPAGLMPSPKDGTITQNPQEFIAKNQKAGGVQYQTDPTAPIIHTTLGKLSTKPNQLEENLKALISTIGVKKIKKATISSTMGPGIKIDPTTILPSVTAS